MKSLGPGASVLARRLSRRVALREVTRGGPAAALLAVLGLQPLTAHPAEGASTDLKVQGGQTLTCGILFVATVRQGPSAGLVLRGAFSGVIPATGSIDQAVLVLTDKTELPVVGQINGRAINFVFQFQDGRRLYGVGTLENDLRLCQGGMGGVFTGPLAGDLGDWGASRHPGGANVLFGDGSVRFVSSTIVLSP